MTANSGFPPLSNPSERPDNGRRPPASSLACQNSPVWDRFGLVLASIWRMSVKWRGRMLEATPTIGAGWDGAGQTLPPGKLRCNADDMGGGQTPNAMRGVWNGRLVFFDGDIIVASAELYFQLLGARCPIRSTLSVEERVDYRRGVLQIPHH